MGTAAYRNVPLEENNLTRINDGVMMSPQDQFDKVTAVKISCPMLFYNLYDPPISARNFLLAIATKLTHLKELVFEDPYRFLNEEYIIALSHY